MPIDTKKSKTTKSEQKPLERILPDISEDIFNLSKVKLMSTNFDKWQFRLSEEQYLDILKKFKSEDIPNCLRKFEYNNKICYSLTCIPLTPQEFKATKKYNVYDLRFIFELNNQKTRYYCQGLISENHGEDVEYQQKSEERVNNIRNKLMKKEDDDE